MKTFTFKIMLIAAFILAIFSCEKEETDNPGGSNNNSGDETPDYYVKYQEEYYAIDKIIILWDDWGYSSSGIATYTVHMVSESVNYDTWLESLTGEGNGLEFHLNNDTLNDFYRPHYQFDTTGNTIEAGEIHEAVFLQDADFFMDEAENTTYIDKGECEISDEGEGNYEFNVEFYTQENNEKVEAYYKGSVQMHKDN
ncbi:MAG: hypothetical protein K9I29_10280 [Bacteroidales bacterium]|nr:hypothetical protein [Bacteroidales bacterium]MCF8328668.1 hypothetical protein [Bacteroidales bacterium]